MPVEIIGYIGNCNASETTAPSGPPMCLSHITASATLHENAGFDRVLVPFTSINPDSFLVGQYVASVTKRLGLMLAHRPGFTAPTVAARQLATLDHLTEGRTAVHIITGGNDKQLAQDGDNLSKDERYDRTEEFLQIVRQEWSSETAFDYAGKYYNVRGAISAIKPKSPNSVPIYFGGSSAAAISVAGKYADVYALWGETYEQVAESVGKVRTAAANHGRNPNYCLSLRPVVADTEEKAWVKAAEILEKAKQLQAESAGRQGHTTLLFNKRSPENEGSRRLLEAASKGARLDKCLWTELALVTGGIGNTTGLVGTPDQVADAMLGYYDLGVSSFLIRGFDLLEDANQYGRDLIPRLRTLVSRHDAGKIQAKAKAAVQ